MTSTHRRLRVVTGSVVTALLVIACGFQAPGAGASAPTTTTTPTTTSAAPTTVAGQRAAAEQQVSALASSRDEVRAQVAGIDSRLKDQYGRLLLSQAAVEDALKQAATARDAADVARTSADRAMGDVRDYAVEAFIRPPAQDALAVLAISQVEEAGYASDVLRIVADQRRKVVDVMVAAEGRAAREQADAETAAADARSRADQAQAQVRALEQARSEQVRLASDLDGRLDAALSEAASLKAVDARAAKDLAEQELALRASVPAPVAQPAAMTKVAAVQVTSAPAGTPTPATAPPAAAVTPGPVPTATRPPVEPPAAVPPPGVVGWSEVTKVGGIWVSKRIAGQVRSLLDAATAAGFSLTGGGFRDPSEQVTLRQAHCGTSTYAVYQMPASQCTPPTARPGMSMHEQGLAIDFLSSGRLISSRSDPAFQWLANNAARFGFFNLPSEPWHWSVNGN